jgi:hypothetical protein
MQSGTACESCYNGSSVSVMDCGQLHTAVKCCCRSTWLLLGKQVTAFIVRVAVVCADSIGVLVSVARPASGKALYYVGGKRAIVA